MEPEWDRDRAGLKAKPATASVLNVEVSPLAKLLPLVGKELKPDEVKVLIK